MTNRPNNRLSRHSQLSVQLQSQVLDDRLRQQLGGNLMDGSFVFFSNASSRDCCADLFLLSTCWTISSGGCCLFFCCRVWGIGRPASPSGTLGKSNFVTGIQPGSGTIFFEAPLGLACCKICCNGVGFRLIVLCLLGPTFTFCCSYKKSVDVLLQVIFVFNKRKNLDSARQ